MSRPGDVDGVGHVLVPLPKLVPDLTPEELVMEALQVPVRDGDHKAANKRFEEVKKIFENLSPSDAGAIYDRLSDLKDPMYNKFFGTFSSRSAGKLLGVLEAIIEKSEEKSPTQPAPLNQAGSPTSPSTKKAEIGLEGAARQAQLQGVFRDRDVIIDRYPEAKDIAEHQFMPPEVKKERLQKLMENASKDEFKQMISDSENWPEKEKTVFNAAMGESEKVMRRIADLPPDDQAKAVSRAQFEWGGIPENESGTETLEKREKAYSAWLEKTDALNQILDEKPIPGLMDPSGLASTVANDILNSPKKMDLLNKLSDANRVKVLTSSVKMGSGISDENAQDLGNSLRGVGAKERNAVIDLLQETGTLEKFLANTNTMAEGLTPRNAGVVSAEYYRMMRAEKNPAKINAWKERMDQFDAYAENHYSKNDYEEYVRIRDHYHR